MYFLRGDQIMVWVVCSGLIPPYNSGGGGVVGGRGAQMLPVRTNNILLLSLFLPHTIFGDCRLSQTADASCGVPSLFWHICSDLSL